MSKKLNENFVINKLKSLDLLLINKYEGYDNSCQILCLKHNKIHKTSYCSAITNKGLSCCRSAKNSAYFKGKFKINIDSAKNIANNNGFELLENVWNGTKFKYKIKCLKHNEIFLVFWQNFIKHKALKCCWLEHQIENGLKKSGVNNPNWKPQLEEKNIRNSNWYYNRTWSKRVKKRDLYMCSICKNRFDSKDLEAHHINSYKMDKISRLNIDEGVTMCKKHHQNFHIKYGRGNNNLEQFQEFKYMYEKLQGVN